jgi:hypothetical protein
MVPQEKIRGSAGLVVVEGGSNRNQAPPTRG